jgi:hypothetical protein
MELAKMPKLKEVDELGEMPKLYKGCVLAEKPKLEERTSWLERLNSTR